MPQKKYIITGIILIVILIITAYQFTVNVIFRSSQPGVSPASQALMSLTPAQRRQLSTERFNIASAYNINKLRAVQASPLWVLVWRIAGIITVTIFTGSGAIYAFRKSRYCAVTTVTDTDGHSVTTKIPIIEETKEERVMYAAAQVVRNLALAQGDVNEQTRQMVEVVGNAVRRLSSPSSRSMLPVPTFQPDHGNSERCLALPVPAKEVLSSPRDDKYFVVGYDSMTHDTVLSSLKKNIFHLNVAGQTGSGKTTSLKFFLAQWLQNRIVHRVFLCDNHIGNEEGLTSQMGALVDLPNVHTCNETLPVEMVKVYRGEMERSIVKKEPWEETWIMILDEGLALCKGISQLKEMLETGTTESRKYGLFLVLVAQTQKHTQIPTEVRDNFPSMLVHRMKPKQANLLLQDKERSRLAGKLTQGQAYFVDAVGKYEGVITVPFVQADDIQLVVKRMGGVLKAGNQLLTEAEVKVKVNPTIELLSPVTIQEKIRGALSPELRLQDIYQQVFVRGHERPVMALGTFKKKLKCPEDRPWRPEEQSILSEWVNRFYQGDRRTVQPM